MHYAPVQKEVTRAAQLLREGKLVGLPTETVYGLAADATNDAAVARIFEAKGRPRFNPLIVHVLTTAAAAELAGFPGYAWPACEAFWPGPLTWVVPRRTGVRLSPLVSAGLDTVAIRVPSHPVARAVLEAVGTPLAAPSANRSGRVSPTEAGHVRDELGGRVAMILDGGTARFGLESTVIDGCGSVPRLLRPGSRTRDEITAVLGPLCDEGAGGEEAPRSPGQLSSHYAPRLPLRMDATSVDETEALLAFGRTAMPGALTTINLSEKGDLREAAARLFGSLRILDRSPATGIAVMPIPKGGIGEAINDRLRRAAHR